MPSASSWSPPGFAVTEVLRRNGRHVLAGATREADGSAVWIKFADPNAGTIPAAELAREAEFLAGLEGDAFLRLIGREDSTGGPVLLLEAFDGKPLHEISRGAALPIPDFLRMAKAMTAAVAQIHSQRVIHNRLAPGNFYVDDARSAARLAGFSHASRLAGHGSEIAAADLSADVLPWLSPEQTGRLNWAVGYGSDLYALGVIFYEMLTGALPFSASDPLEWVHCHLAKAPVPPSQIAPGIPPLLSRIVLRLLAKNPADRYLSAAGLLADLARAETALAASPSASFELGQSDCRTSFVLPDRVYGREKEYAVLSRALAEARAGRSAAVLVAGPPGAGKSTLVSEWQASDAPQALFASGKYERFQHDEPYLGVRQAVQAICRQITCETPERIAAWKQRIGESLGSIGAVMTEAFPSLQTILGPQPPVPELPAAEAGNRFMEAFRQLIRGLTGSDLPLVLFLDDMQWADSASLVLLEPFLSASGGGLLMILGFREEPSAGADAVVAAMQASGREWERIALRPLDQNDIVALLRDLLPGAEQDLDALAAIVLQKSGGNPFFLRQFLSQLAEEDLIYYQDGWRWKEDAIRESRITDNVVAFVAGRLQRLSPAVQSVLEYGSCFGPTLPMALLAELLRVSPSSMRESLDAALDAGALTLRAGEYVFVHDRVREAASSLIPAESLPKMHLAIADRMLREPEKLDENLFEVVRHLAAAEPLLDHERRLEAGRLNLQAATRAREAAAFGPSLDYARSAYAAVSDATWNTAYAFSAAAGLVLAEALFLNSRLGEFESLVAELFTRLHDPAHVVALHEQKILALSASSRHADAIQASYEALRYLSEEFPSGVTEIISALQEDREAIEKQIAGGDIGSLREHGRLDDARLDAIIRILLRMTPDTIMLGLGALYALVVARAVRICLAGGYSFLAPVAFANYSVVEFQLTGNAERAHAWALLAATVDDAQGGNLFAPTRFIPGWFVSAWKVPVRECVPIFETASRVGLEHGDILFGCFSAAAATVFQAWSGAPLAEVIAEAERHREVIRGRVYSADYHCLLERQVARCLMGLTRGNTSFADDQCPAAQIAAVVDTRSAHQIGYYHVARLRIAWLFDEVDEARSALEDVAPFEPGLNALLAQADLNFYRALFLLGTDAEKSLETAQEAAEWFSAKAAACPANFRACELILSGEIARVEGRSGDAQGLFSRAMEEADEHRLLHYAALAAELAVRLHLTAGDTIAAGAYLDQARSRYTAWGATARVAYLDEKYRSLRAAGEPVADWRAPATGATSLDLISLMKSSQAISGEIVMCLFVDRMMATIIENAGAEWGGLILREGNALYVEAIRQARETGNVELLHLPLEKSGLPRSVIEHVAATLQPLVLSDARRDREFGNEPAIVRSGARSVLCAPIVLKAELTGIVYLQNNLSSGVFTPDRLEIIHLLSSQIAVSLANARYHQQSLEWERVRRDLESARDIQQSLVPQSLPDASPYSVALRSVACYEVGGDYTDIVVLPGGEWVMLVADVAGKGLASAMIASSLRSAFRAIANTGVPLPQLARQLNELHYAEGVEARRRYVTAAFFRFDRRTHRIEVVNAAHPPVFLVSADGSARRFEAAAPPIGLFPGLDFPSESAVMAEGDRLLAYTDGLSETRAGDDEYGSDRLLEFFSGMQFESAEDVLDQIWNQIRQFSGDSHPEDDMTALTLLRPRPSIPTQEPFPHDEPASKP